MLDQKLTFLLFWSGVLFQTASLTRATNEKSPKLVFYYGPTVNSHQSFTLDEVRRILQHPNFIHNQTTVYMHGYNLTQDASSVRLMVDSYLKRDTINFLTIDWTEMANASYVSAQENILEFAPKVAQSLRKLIRVGMDPSSLSLVGHSLGALAVGIIAREVHKQSDGKVLLARVTALDPSNAAVHIVFLLPSLKQSDAHFVDVIHTDAGGIGSLERMGHANFWPNRGVAIQPGCPEKGVNDKCSHRKAWAYWAESVANQNPELYRVQGADSKTTVGVAMGLDCRPIARGDYYLSIRSDFGSVPELGLNG